MNKNFLLFFNFLEEYPLFKYFLISTMMILSLNAFIAVDVENDKNMILDQVTKSVADTDLITRMIIYQVGKIVFLSCVTYLFPIICDYYLTKVYRNCICFYMTKALNIKHNLYKEIGSGYIRGVIDRKSYNYVFGFEILLFEIFYGSVYVFAGFGFMLYYFGVKLALYAVFSLMIFIFVNIFIIRFRNECRRRYNERYSTLISKIYTVISNYDIIKANNNETRDLDKLDKNLENIQEYGIYCMFLQAFGGLITKSIITLSNTVIFYCITKQIWVYNISTASRFLHYNTLFCVIKSRITHVREQITKFNQYLTDINSDDWDEVKVDIENMELYYNYQQEKLLKDIELQDIEKSAQLKNNESYEFHTTDEKTVNDARLLRKTVLETHNLHRRGVSDGIREFKMQESIVFKDFCLLIGERILINPSNFEIKRGEKVGVVGKNGTGKSTFLNVLLRFEDYKGEIVIDNVEMSTINKVDQRDKISYIPQTPGILSGTILDNLRYANANMTLEEGEKLCNKFNMHFNDLNMDVGENGDYLSGGQKQRLNFLRGVVKNGDIFILDEPTASMDPQAANNLIEKLHTELKDKTVFMTVHNHIQLKDFDKIIGIYNKEIRVYTSYEAYIDEAYLF